MQTRLSLALANKLRMLFETADKFLTYPLGIGFSYRYLNFMREPSVSGLSAVEQLNNKGDFARLLNFIPEDSAIYLPDSSRYLWTEMKDVLIESNYATSALTDAETKQLNEALDFLTDEQVAPDGTRTSVYSPAVSSYYSYKTVYDAAEKTYLDEKISVETATGTEGDRLKQQWKAYREKQLLDYRDKAMQDWISLGNKLRVEQCQTVQKLLEPKKYLNLKGQSYLNDIALSEIADTNGVGIGFYTTFFSPIDIFNQGTGWLKLNLTKGEINSLVQSAPASLKTVFNPTGDTDDSIQEISLEYNNIPVLRPWFHPEFFDVRFWKMVGDIVVSDGNVPRKGKIPAYINSILVLRNLVITRKKSDQAKPVVLPILGQRALTNIKFTTAIPAAQKIATAPMRATLAEKPANISAIPIRSQPSVLARTSLVQAQPSVLAQTSLVQVQPIQRTCFIDAKYLGTTIKMPTVIIPPKQLDPNAPAPSQDLVKETYSFDGVVVLAYVCRRVPKSPNPDNTLKWT